MKKKESTTIKKEYVLYVTGWKSIHPSKYVFDVFGKEENMFQKMFDFLMFNWSKMFLKNIVIIKNKLLKYKETDFFL